MAAGLCFIQHQGSLSKQAIERNFEDLHPLLNPQQAKAEADRCLYCYDAPCITACPTSIDIPTFIHQIRSDNLHGSAKTILSENIMGGTCARACPTEILCEQACVLNVSQQQTVEIGALQRFAVDALLESTPPHPFKRAGLSDKKIAVIGAGPAGLSCAHRAAMLGHDVTIFEARNKPGGLNEYGLAAYKMTHDFAQKEIEFLLQIGGIRIQYEQSLGKQLSLAKLAIDYDAVFIGVGLTQANQVGMTGENDGRVIDALQLIETIRQTDDRSSISVGHHVVVIGAGNTAIDAAVQCKRLGSENVTLVYRRGEESMGATRWEVDLARKNGVNMRFWSSPKAFYGDHQSEQLEESEQVGQPNQTANIEFEITKYENHSLQMTGQYYRLPCDQVLVAVGQQLDQQIFTTANDLTPNIQHGKVVVNDDYETSIKGIFAGGDCIASGEDLTVQAVQDGKQAAHSIDRYLSKGELSG